MRSHALKKLLLLASVKFDFGPLQYFCAAQECYEEIDENQQRAITQKLQ